MVDSKNKQLGKTKYKIEDDFLVLSDGQKIHIPTLEILCGFGPASTGFYRISQSGRGNINIIIGGKNNRVKFEGNITNSNNLPQ